MCSFRAKCIHCDRALNPLERPAGRSVSGGAPFLSLGWGNLSLPALALAAAAPGVPTPLPNVMRCRAIRPEH